MKQSLIKLVDVILKRIEEQSEGAQSESGLRSWLKGQGYKKGDIDAAMKLIAPRFTPQTVDQTFVPGPVRTLTPQEEFKLSPDARDALVRLEYYGLISPYEREVLLDHVAGYDGEVGVEELDYILSWTICGGRDVESQQTIYNVLEGQTDTFH